MSEALKAWLLDRCKVEASAGRLSLDEATGVFTALDGFEPAQLAIDAWLMAKQMAMKIAAECYPDPKHDISCFCQRCTDHCSALEIADKIMEKL